jgi:phosphoglycolate phosphatase-like HAD superfamily hydrolase
LIKEVFEFIKNNSHNEYHIVSGTEEKDLKFICTRLGISKYFKSIHGSPVKKEELIKSLIISLDNYIFIGDSIDDFDASKKNEVIFYGYNNHKLKNVSRNYIKDFKSFEREIKKYGQC